MTRADEIAAAHTLVWRNLPAWPLTFSDRKEADGWLREAANRIERGAS